MTSSFNNNHTEAVLFDVGTERRRTTQRGRNGELPHACEDPNTHWGIKLGVLGEEYGEVCKAIIETPPNVRIDVYHELVQVASVAVSMAESIVAQGESSVPYQKESTDTMSVDAQQVENESAPPPWHEHHKVLMEALDIYRSKNPTYQDAWRMYGWRGSLMQLRSGCERAWRVLWAAEPHAGGNVVDDLLDLINYAVFTIRNIRGNNRDGSWEYPS